MDKKMLFIYNPKSGKGEIQQKLSAVVEILTSGERSVLIYPTRSQGDAVEAVGRYRDEVDWIVCSGGDGTLDEVVTGVMKYAPGITVGYIPSGSTNDFASSLAISKDMVTAAEDIMKGEIYRCDVGRFDDNYFVYIAAFGLFTDVAYETDQNLKNNIGHVAYLLEAGKRIFHIPEYHLEVETEDHRISGSFSFGMITNSRFVGGMRNITGSTVDMNDGLFEVTLVRTPQNPIELSEIIATLLSEENRESPLVEVIKAGKVKVTSQEEIKWTLDGEYGGTMREVLIENDKKSVRILLNRSKNS